MRSGFRLLTGLVAALDAFYWTTDVAMGRATHVVVWRASGVRAYGRVGATNAAMRD